MTDRTHGQQTNGATDDDIFRAAYPRMRRYAAIVAPPHIEPEDLLQDALAATLKKHRLVDLDNAEFYLRRVMVNLASNQRRRWIRGKKAHQLLAASSDRPAEDYPSDLSELMWLTSRQRAVLYLNEVEGYPFAEIAEMVGCSVPAARMSATRARRRMRDALGAEA